MSLRDLYIEQFGYDTEIKRKRFNEWAEENGFNKSYSDSFLLEECKWIRRGYYDPSQPKDVSTQASYTVTNTVEDNTENSDYEDVFVPQKSKEFVSWGFTSKLKKIVQSNQFFPTYITGLSGNGKTLMVQQVCAELNRPYVRVQINPETDEDDLIGGFRLKDGETIFVKGPVIRAMESGAILLIDEIDRGSNKLMCLQGILEGNPYLIKKTGEVVSPQKGFNVIATANTKGKGDEEGKFISSTIIDDAFLERFNITVEQSYPPKGTETKILKNHLKAFGCKLNSKSEAFINSLIKWSNTIRETYKDGGIDDVISTRRLCHIIQTYSIFESENMSIKLCISRFEKDTKDSMWDLYEKIIPSEDSTNDEGDYEYDESRPF